MGKLLDGIQDPKDLKKLEIDQLTQLSKEIRKYLVEVVSECGGHLSSNLGVVELTVALHYAFNSPIDKIIWDVGHQSYVHKILTGRKEALKQIRQFGGISGFPKRAESSHDAFDTGHSSTSISAALGFAKARDIKGESNYVISVIGDGALTGGMAFEALNNVANMEGNFIVILNDNQMSISKNVGGISLYLDSIRTATFYHDVKEDVQRVLRRIPKYGEGVINAVRDVKDSVKQLFIPGMFFEEMGFTYLGPIDGHNIRQVITTLNQAKKVDGPTLIHINTVKGKGYKYAEQYPTKFHGTKPFEMESGKEINLGSSQTYSGVFGETLSELAREDQSIVAITAAMPEGTGLSSFSQEFPGRFFDVGIAEQHAVTFAGGLALSGLKPFVAVYSSFLQRAYDQIVHDIALQKLPVVICIDRTGLVGDDGETHQGVFDSSFLNHIPNMTLIAPKNGQELAMMIRFAAKYQEGPLCIKYPRGSVAKTNNDLTKEIEFGKMELVSQGKDIAILSVGTIYNQAQDTYIKLCEEGLCPTLINVRFVKPLDVEMITTLAKDHKYIIVIEENAVIGGFGSEVIRLLNDVDVNNRVLLCGIKDQFIQHGTCKELLDICGLSAEQLYNQIKTFINAKSEQVDE